MRILGRNKIHDFIIKHASSKGALEAWLSEATSSCWRNSHDIKQRYRSADFLANNRVIFNIKGNRFRLVVQVRYQNGIVLVEWVGTHAEYSKKRF